MRYSQIKNMDVVNGEGFACSLFLQGCSHHCKGCFNKETWDFQGGEEFTNEVKDKFIELCKNPHIDCISILGGEPFDQDINDLYGLLYELNCIRKPIYVWSGYTYEELLNRGYKQHLNLIDYLIDGKFIEEQKDLTLKLRGSKNQRIIDIKRERNIEMLILKILERNKKYLTTK